MSCTAPCGGISHSGYLPDEMGSHGPTILWGEGEVPWAVGIWSRRRVVMKQLTSWRGEEPGVVDGVLVDGEGSGNTLGAPSINLVSGKNVGWACHCLEVSLNSHKGLLRPTKAKQLRQVHVALCRWIRSWKGDRRRHLPVLLYMPLPTLPSPCIIQLEHTCSAVRNSLH